MGRVCCCCGEGVPDDVPCGCDYEGEDDYDCRRCGQLGAYEEGGLCSDCADTLEAAAEKRAATRKANRAANIAKTRAAVEGIPADADVVYPVIPIDCYKHADCPQVLQSIRDRFPGLAVIDTPSKFCDAKDWRENWPHLLPRVKRFVVWPRDDNSIGLGGYQELASASTFGTTLNDFETLPPILHGCKHFPSVEVLVFKDWRFYRLHLARTLHSRAECGGLGSWLLQRTRWGSREYREMMQQFAEVVAGEEV